MNLHSVQEDYPTANISVLGFFVLEIYAHHIESRLASNSLSSYLGSHILEL